VWGVVRCQDGNEEKSVVNRVNERSNKTSEPLYDQVSTRLVYAS
jgi:hypothetical protein